mmetsp:Transcript_124012/g.362000  ORF Transcript_124012/g.362000 Transcript_124012/m.362000 type:complete len:252 (-) Transcript_124012:938-1693(-)
MPSPPSAGALASPSSAAVQLCLAAEELWLCLGAEELVPSGGPRLESAVDALLGRLWPVPVTVPRLAVRLRKRSGSWVGAGSRSPRGTFPCSGRVGAQRTLSLPATPELCLLGASWEGARAGARPGAASVREPGREPGRSLERRGVGPEGRLERTVEVALRTLEAEMMEPLRALLATSMQSPLGPSSRVCQMSLKEVRRVARGALLPASLYTMSSMVLWCIFGVLLDAGRRRTDKCRFISACMLAASMSLSS